MNIAIALNENYYYCTYVMLLSLFENNRNSDIEVFIMYNLLCDEYKEEFQKLSSRFSQKISFVDMSEIKFPEDLPSTTQWPVEIYYRLALQDILPEEVDRVLYLDTDVIVNGDISEFYNSDFKGKSFVGVQDYYINKNGLYSQQKQLLGQIIEEKPDYVYFNSGVLLMNLKKLRGLVSLNVYLEAIREIRHFLFCFDQDLLNFLFYDDILLDDSERINLPAHFFYEEGKGYEWIAENGLLIHFTGKKPWSSDSVRFETERLWWEYAKKTPYYIELMEKVFFGEMEASYAHGILSKMSAENEELSKTLKKIKKIYFGG